MEKEKFEEIEHNLQMSEVYARLALEHLRRARKNMEELNREKTNTSPEGEDN